MPKIEIALSPHARPQALDKTSYSLQPDLRKGLGSNSLSAVGHAADTPPWAINRYRGNAAGRDQSEIVSSATSQSMIRGKSCACSIATISMISAHGAAAPAGPDLQLHRRRRGRRGTYRRNTAAFEDCDLVPSVLQGVRRGRPVGDRAGPEAAACRSTARRPRCSGCSTIRASAPWPRAAEKFGTMFGVSSLGTVEPGGGAADQRRPAGLPVLLPQGPRAEPRDDGARQGGRRRR